MELDDLLFTEEEFEETIELEGCEVKSPIEYFLSLFLGEEPDYTTKNSPLKYEH